MGSATEVVPFALYLVSLMQQVRSVASVNTAVYGVSWVHKKSGQEPSQHPLIKQVMEAARRILSKPATRKVPLKTDLVTKLVLPLQQGSLAELQLAALSPWVFWFSPLG